MNSTMKTHQADTALAGYWTAYKPAALPKSRLVLRSRLHLARAFSRWKGQRSGFPK